MKWLLYPIVLFGLWNQSAAALSMVQAVEPCFGENIAARKIAELPPEIKQSIDDIFEDKLGDSDSEVLMTDNITSDVKKYPEYKFYRAYKIRDVYVVLMQYKSQLYYKHSFGYRFEKETGRYALFPFYFFKGPICPILTAIQNEVINPNDFPKYIVDAITKD